MMWPALNEPMRTPRVRTSALPLIGMQSDDTGSPSAITFSPAAALFHSPASESETN
jgi:hypothetical protein